jgi:aminopeptidase N
MKKGFLLLLYFTLFSIPGLLAQKYTPEDSLRGAMHANRTCYDLHHYHLKIKVEPITRYISGSNRLSCIGLSESRTLQVDLDPAFDIERIETSSGPARFSRTGSSVVVRLPFMIRPNEKFWVEVHYKGHPHPAAHAPWDGGFVWSKDKEGFPWIGVACEGDGASLWFPSKDHPADEPDSAFLQYEVPKNLTAVGNGQFLGKKAVSDSTQIFSFRVSYPINHYNISFNSGAYRNWTDTVRLPESGRVLKMSFFALPEDEEKARIQWAQSKTVIRQLSSLFGDYPFVSDGYKMVQTPYLGMEHQSCIAYGDKFQDNAFGFDYIVMHETGHEWWGNRTSSDDHADMWIHESFCTYSEALFVETTQGKETALKYLLGQKKKIKNRTPVQGPRDVYFNDWKDSDMYYKGSWMLHSLRYVVNNDSIWFSFLKDLGKETGLKPLSGNQLKKHISQKLHLPLDGFFAQFLESTEWPVLEIRSSQKEGKNLLSFRWNCSRKDFISPVPVMVNGKHFRLEANSDWKEMELTEPIVKAEPNEGLFLYKLQVLKN